MTIAESGRDKGQWLKAEVVKGKLVVSIGVDVLAFACQMHMDGEAVEASEGRETQADMVISDPEGFARDVCLELLREDEAGNHPVGRLLDEMAMEAANRGSLYLSDRSEVTSEDC